MLQHYHGERIIGSSCPDPEELNGCPGRNSWTMPSASMLGWWAGWRSWSSERICIYSPAGNNLTTQRKQFITTSLLAASRTSGMLMAGDFNCVTGQLDVEENYRTSTDSSSRPQRCTQRNMSLWAVIHIPSSRIFSIETGSSIPDPGHCSHWIR